MGAGRGSLRRRDRLRKSKDFQRLSRQGRRAAEAHVVVVTGPCREPARAPRGRLGLTVSRRVGGAVVRNRVKRRIREWYRTRRTELGLTEDLVVIARRGAGELPSAVLHRELTAACQASRRPERPSGPEGTR